MAIAFLISIFITFLFLKNTSSTMEETITKNEVATFAGDLDRLFLEKYNLIPEYLLLANDEKLNEYLDYSKEFAITAKALKKDLSQDQLQLFNQLIENNHELDQYFFSTVVPNVQQINTNDFQEIQSSVQVLKVDTSKISQQLKTTAIEFNVDAIHSSQANLSKVNLILIISSAVSIIISFLFLYFISKGIRKNLRNIVNQSKAIANGQLNNSNLDYKGKDEIGQLSESMNEMGHSLKEMISNISQLSTNVDQQSTILLNSSEEVKHGTDQVAITIEEMAKGATSQADNATVISERTRDFSEDIVTASEHTDKLVMFSKQVLDVSIIGNSQMVESLSQMGRVNDVVKSSVTKVKSLEAKTQSITEIVQVIKSIAEQTNLLALNASIEAARAGEAGKGFAVVASEVRKLAEEVRHSVENITGIVVAIKEETTMISEELNIGYAEVHKGTDLIEQTGKQFVHIKDQVEEMSEKVTEISTVFTKIETSSREINESVESIAASSEESAAGSEEITATVYDQSQSVESITNSARTLTEMVEQMNSMIKKFQL